MAKRSHELTTPQLANLSREELNTRWLEVKKELEARDINSLTPDEKNYLILAIFYTTKQQ